MIIFLRKTDEAGLRKGIHIAYEGDEDMRTKIHILKGETTERQVEYTFEQTARDPDYVMDYFEVVKKEGEVETHIGYTSLLFTPQRILHTFGIGIQYRDRNTLKEWLKAIKRKFDNKGYMLTLRAGNERAVKFFVRNGFETKFDNENNQHIVWLHPLLPPLLQQA